MVLLPSTSSTSIKPYFRRRYTDSVVKVMRKRSFVHSLYLLLSMLNDESRLLPPAGMDGYFFSRRYRTVHFHATFWPKQRQPSSQLSQTVALTAGSIHTNRYSDGSLQLVVTTTLINMS